MVLWRAGPGQTSPRQFEAGEQKELKLWPKESQVYNNNKKDGAKCHMWEVIQGWEWALAAAAETKVISSRMEDGMRKGQGVQFMAMAMNCERECRM